VSATHYHAGRTKLARERAQQSFEAGRTRVLVATNAFGMGIDIPDIRLIVHFQTPGSVEAYYQEAGRAGRDGEAARCLMFFGLGDMMTQRRLAQQSQVVGAASQRGDAALAAIEDYAIRLRCRHQALVSHFTGGDEEAECGRCDFCRGEATEFEGPAGRGAAESVEPLPESALTTIVAAVDRLTRPVGRKNLAGALRGGKAKTLSRGGLLTLPEYGTLSEFSEAAVVAAIDGLLADGRLQRAGAKYPTVWIPGKPLRASKTTAGSTSTRPARKARAKSRYGGDIARALDSYRRRTARTLGWKAYMVFQKNVILAIDREEPDSLDALARIHGLGPAKIERFGEDVLGMVRKHRRRDSD
jgi:ATP-dependent DNA helicase RecQ